GEHAPSWAHRPLLVRSDTERSRAIDVASPARSDLWGEGRRLRICLESLRHEAAPLGVLNDRRSVPAPENEARDARFCTYSCQAHRQAAAAWCRALLDQRCDLRHLCTGRTRLPLPAAV